MFEAKMWGAATASDGAPPLLLTLIVSSVATTQEVLHDLKFQKI
jgi:hypothetical protein